MYDLVIIGSGPAGHTAALEAAKLKKKTALIEESQTSLGGVCLNEGCIPLKGMLHHSAHQKDYADIKERVFGKVSSIRDGLRGRIERSGIEIIHGHAKFISSTELEVEGKTIQSKNFLIATGSVPRNTFSAPADSPDKIFNLERIPEKALIIGGGVIGCEYASFLNNLGAKVDIVEIGETILPGEDGEITRVLAREFKKKKINVLEKSSVQEIHQDKTVVIKNEENFVTGKYDMIFDTTGRIPNTKGLGLENAGVKTDSKGFISADENLRTTSENIYAAGDCIATPMLAYTATAEASAAVEHMFHGKTPRLEYSALPKVVFSSPQAGSIGASEESAKKSGTNHKVYRYFFKAIGKAVVEENDAGFIKLIIDTDKNEIIGAAAVGNEIVDIMNELSVIIKSRIIIDTLRGCFHVHPSYSEIILEALAFGG